MQENTQRSGEPSQPDVASITREAGHVSNQIAQAQVSAARALFNMSNMMTMGAWGAFAPKFEEGLDLYQRTVKDLRSTTEHMAEFTEEQSRQYQNLSGELRDRYATVGNGAFDSLRPDQKNSRQSQGRQAENA